MLTPHPDLPRPPGRLSPGALPLGDLPAARRVPEQRGPVAVLGAHPDDETVGAGRLVAHLADRGPVVVHVATAGEGCFGDREVPGIDDVGATRRAEWEAALTALGARRGRCAGLPDGDLARQADAVTAWVEDVVASEGPGVLLVPWRLDPHPDHAAVGEAAAAVAALRGVTVWEYPVWAPAWCSPEQLAQTGWRLQSWTTDSAADTARQAALRCYPSQTGELAPGWGAVVPPEALAHHGRQLVCVQEAL
ncbi:PIG-L deacetylase family protein [Kytococcus sedentarius]|uniref:PIG-L deacetylase family protein n=1 Tax=Kytococcus sedentarius TaxID=1276 RepID=UPI0035BC6EDD